MFARKDLIRSRVQEDTHLCDRCNISPLSRNSNLHDPVANHGFLLLELGQQDLRFPGVLRLDLIRSPDRNILGSEIAVQMLQDLLDGVTANVVRHHHRRHGDLELGREGHELQFLVQLRDKLRGAGECHARHGQEAPIHTPVLADALAEGAALVVDCEGGDLLDELEEVHRRVEEGRFEFALEIDVWLAGLVALHVGGDVDQSDDVDGELAEDGADDVGVEDVGLGAFFGEAFDGLAIVSMGPCNMRGEFHVPLLGRWRGSRHS